MADSPQAIPVFEWTVILRRVKDEIVADRVGLTAAGIAFYSLLATFPALTALMALSGLLFDPQRVTAQLDGLTAILSDEAVTIIQNQAEAVTSSQGLGVAVVIGTLLSILSASKGMSSLMKGLNIAHDQAETRGLVRKTITQVALTAFVIVGLLLVIIGAIVLPSIFVEWPQSAAGRFFVAVLQFIVFGVLISGALMVLYRFGPSRDAVEWKWLLPGAALACCLWLIASYSFSVYVANFGNYNEAFGSLAGVVFLLIWLWLSAYTVLAGAELNAQMEALWHRRTKSKAVVQTDVQPREVSNFAE